MPEPVPSASGMCQHWDSSHPHGEMGVTKQPKTTRRRAWLQYAVWCLGFLLVFGIVGMYRVFRMQPQEQKINLNPHLESYYVAYPHRYRFIVDQPELCRQHKPYIVIIVPVAPKNLEARDAIRSTWGNESLVQDKDILVLFLLGLPSGDDLEVQQELIRQENLRHRDLIQSNFIDSYRNLTIKTMVMLEWLRDRCPEAYYAAKVDADMLLNIVALIQMLLRHTEYMTDYITGLVWYENVVIRDPDNKFYIPPEVYPYQVYPPYPLGMCYIISMDLPEKILEASRKIRPIFIEDVYIGLCLERLHITPTTPPDIRQFVVNPPPEYDHCYYKDLIAVVTNSPAKLKSFWMDLNKPGPAC